MEEAKVKWIKSEIHGWITGPVLIFKAPSDSKWAFSWDSDLEWNKTHWENNTNEPLNKTLTWIYHL